MIVSIFNTAVHNRNICLMLMISLTASLVSWCCIYLSSVCDYFSADCSKAVVEQISGRDHTSYIHLSNPAVCFTHSDITVALAEVSQGFYLIFIS